MAHYWPQEKLDHLETGTTYGLSQSNFESCSHKIKYHIGIKGYSLFSLDFFFLLNRLLIIFVPDFLRLKCIKFFFISNAVVSLMQKTPTTVYSIHHWCSEENRSTVNMSGPCMAFSENVLGQYHLTRKVIISCDRSKGHQNCLTWCVGCKSLRFSNSNYLSWWWHNTLIFQAHASHLDSLLIKASYELWLC